MNKEEFLTSIKNSLEGIPEKELKDILYDYEEHFTIGLAEGKTEEQICEELGDPKEIGRNYISGFTIKEKEQPPHPIKRNNTLYVILALVCITVGLLLIIKPMYNRNIFSNGNSIGGINIGSNGIKVGDLSIDSTGIHSGSINIDSTGIHGDGISIDANGINTGTSVTSSSVLSQSYNMISVNESKNIDLVGITKLNIENESSNINFIQDNGKLLRVELKGEVSNNLKPVLEVISKHGEAKVSLTFDKLSSETNNSTNLKFNIYIPSTYNNDINLKSQSGNIDIKDLKLNNLLFDISSGNTQIDNLNLNNLEMSSVSGNLTAKSISSKNAKIKWGSGNIEVSNLLGNANIALSSGNINLKYNNFNNNIFIDSGCGNVWLDLPSESKFNLSALTHTGNLTVNFPVDKTDSSAPNNPEKMLKGSVGTSNNTVKINCSTGNINIE